MVVRHILDTCIDRWISLQYGIDLPALGRTTHLVWADNVYFLGHSCEQVLSMTQDFTDMLVAMRMRWKLGSLQLLHTDQALVQQAAIWQHGESVPVKVVEDMEVLGTLITSANDNLRPVRHRLAKAAAAFWSLSSVLRCPAVSLKQRFDEFCLRVQPIALYGAAGWTWSRSLYNELLRWENSFLRRIA